MINSHLDYQKIKFAVQVIASILISDSKPFLIIRDDDMISYASMMSLADDRFDDFDDDNEDDNMAKRRSGSSFGSFRSSIGI